MHVQTLRGIVCSSGWLTVLFAPFAFVWLHGSIASIRGWLFGSCIVHGTIGASPAFSSACAKRSARPGQLHHPKARHFICPGKSLTPTSISLQILLDHTDRNLLAVPNNCAVLRNMMAVSARVARFVTCHFVQSFENQLCQSRPRLFRFPFHEDTLFRLLHLPLHKLLHGVVLFLVQQMQPRPPQVQN
jgi:hypothetical protein